MHQLASLRLLRALLTTSTAIALAGAGHLLGGGALPAPPVLLAVGLLVLIPVTWTAGRRLTVPRLLTVLGAAHAGLHEAFTVLTAPSTCAPAGHCHHGSTAPELAMLAGHVLAVVATAVVLSRVEAGLDWALEWLRPLRTAARPVAVHGRVPRPPLPPVDRPVPVWRRLRQDRVRGPPAAGA